MYYPQQSQLLGNLVTPRDPPSECCTLSVSQTDSPRIPTGPYAIMIIPLYPRGPEKVLTHFVALPIAEASMQLNCFGLGRAGCVCLKPKALKAWSKVCMEYRQRVRCRFCRREGAEAQILLDAGAWLRV